MFHSCFKEILCPSSTFSEWNIFCTPCGGFEKFVVGFKSLQRIPILTSFHRGHRVLKHPQKLLKLLLQHKHCICILPETFAAVEHWTEIWVDNNNYYYSITVLEKWIMLQKWFNGYFGTFFHCITISLLKSLVSDMNSSWQYPLFFVKETTNLL